MIYKSSAKKLQYKKRKKYVGLTLPLDVIIHTAKSASDLGLTKSDLYRAAIIYSYSDEAFWIELGKALRRPGKLLKLLYFNE